MKWIRWWGLTIFLGLSGLIVVMWLFLIDGIVERTIEEMGTDMLGAKVELSSADVSLMPVELVLSGLEVTNPEAPMTNGVEVSHLVLEIDGGELLRRKIIINAMTAEGIRFGTPRDESGAVADREQASDLGRTIPSSVEGGDIPALPSFQPPDVENILQQEELGTIRLVNALRADLGTSREQWEARLQQLPGERSFSTYRERIEKLKNAGKGGVGGIVGGIGEITSLKEDIEQDLEALKGAQRDFSTGLELLKRRVGEIKKAPEKDVKRLRGKYSLSPEGLANLGTTLLGQKVGSWVNEGMTWYKKFQPIIQRMGQSGGGGKGPEVITPMRGNGVDVRFRERHPLPDFLILLVKASVQLSVGDLSGKVEHVTPDQPVLGKPLTFEFSGEKLEGVQAIMIKGNLNHIDPSRPNDRINFQATGYNIQKLSLSTQPTWPVELSQGEADLTGRVSLRGDALTGHFTGNLTSLNIQAGIKGDTNLLTQSLSSALAGVSQVSFTAAISGMLDSPSIDFTTDLDRVMSRAAGRLVKNLSRRFTNELTSAVQAKVAAPLEDLKTSFGGFEELGGDLAKRLTMGNTLLTSLTQQGGLPKGIPGGEFPGGLRLPF